MGRRFYVRHEIVHNKHVVETLRNRGAIFVEEVDEIPEGAVTIFSAHGVSRKVEDGAHLRELDVIDATCPLVTKVHKEGRRYAGKGYDIVLIGHLGHPEVEGTLGQIPGTVHVISEPHEVDTLEVTDPDCVSFVTQTTLSVNDTKDVIAALKKRFPNIIGPDTRDICLRHSKTARQPFWKWSRKFNYCSLLAPITAPTPIACARLVKITVCPAI